MWSALCESNFLVVKIELEDGEMPLHIFIGTENAQLLNSNRTHIFAYLVLADVIGVFKLLLLNLLAAVALVSACEMDCVAASCQLY